MYCTVHTCGRERDGRLARRNKKGDWRNKEYRKEKQMNGNVEKRHAFHPNLDTYIQDMRLVLELKRKGYSSIPKLLVMVRLELRKRDHYLINTPPGGRGCLRR